MHANMRILGRAAIDMRTKNIDREALAPIPGSWARVIREVLGMTTRQFARRLGVSQPRVIALEKAEEHKTITLETLERAAHALNCDLVYTLVPRKPLQQMVEDQAFKAAERKVVPTSHSMALEAQSVNGRAMRAQIQRLAKEMIAKGDKAIWESE